MWSMLACVILAVAVSGTKMWSIPRPCFGPHRVMYGVFGCRCVMIDVWWFLVCVSSFMSRWEGIVCRCVPIVCIVGSGVCDWKSPSVMMVVLGNFFFIVFAVFVYWCFNDVECVCCTS